MVNNMQKRGQVSVFVIIGVVLIIIVSLLFFLRREAGLFISPQTFLSEKSVSIQDDLKDCLTQATSKNLDLFLKQGGDFNPTSFKLYESKKVKYFCRNVPGQETCLNVIPTYLDLVNNLNKKIEAEVNNCVGQDLGGFGYEVTPGTVKTEIISSLDGVAVKASYNVVVKKGENEQKVNDIILPLNVPLQELYAISLDIINSEANRGYFEQLIYMLNNRGEFIVEVDRPFPDKIYKVHEKDSNAQFWFAIEGE
jgi:hypothetical protein